jgi:branched-subunit amino acid ABC-type transport system permease component
MLFVFLRALTVSVLGGFNSVALALAGSVLFSVMDSMMRTGLFGNISGGQREVIAVGLLFVGVVVINRFRAQGKELLEAEGL